jgi:hypothetical protein
VLLIFDLSSSYKSKIAQADLGSYKVKITQAAWAPAFKKAGQNDGLGCTDFA